MRTVGAALLAFALAHLAYGQSDEIPPSLLNAVSEKIRSDDWQQREAGFRELMAIGKPTQPSVASILFKLLAIENQYVLKKYAEGVGVNEGFSDPYYSSLLGSAMVVYIDAPNRERFLELAQSSYNPESPFAIQLSRDVPKYLDALTQIASTHHNEIKRLNATWLIGKAVADSRFDQAGRSLAMTVIGGRLNDVDRGVRGRAANVLKDIGGIDAHRMLVEARGRATKRVPPRSERELRLLDSAIAATDPRKLPR